MTLDVQVEKKLRDFTLDASFSASSAPLSILGASGAGKTMLLRCIAGLEQPDYGRIALNGRILFDSELPLRTPARERRIGMLFQNYALFPHRTVAANIAFGLHHLQPDERMARVSALVARTHLTGLESRYPRELSGGEQQRVALARALAVEPEGLLLDEPLSSLDTHLRSRVEALLQETFAAYHRPTLLVTHNSEEAYRLGEQLLVLSRGRVAACGPKEEIFRRPPTREVAQLTGCKNFSRALRNADGTIEALDWGCRVHVEKNISKPAFIGIRAHHIDFVESSGERNDTQNIFSCWLVRTSETPFRITLYLRLHDSSEESATQLLQAEVFKEKWQRFRDQPLPWRVKLPHDSLFVMPE
jgi:molybdate transport system permease protein